MTTKETLQKYFLNYLWMGVVVVLITIVMDLKIQNKDIILLIIIKLLESIGISIIVASIFTFASGTSQFVNKIKQLLQEIVLSRDFLGGIDKKSKIDALNSILKPSSEEKSLYTNIEDYYNTYIKQTMDITSKCIRSNYNVNAKAFMKDNCVVVESIITYRLFPTLEGYKEIKVGFAVSELKNECKYIIVNTPHGERKTHENFEYHEVDGAFGKVSLSTINLKDYDKTCTHLDIEIRSIEYGRDHWNLLLFQALQPTDGFRYYLKADKGLFIHECTTFVYGAKFYIDQDTENHEVSISISCNEWINEGTGVAMVISTNENNFAMKTE